MIEHTYFQAVVSEDGVVKVEKLKTETVKRPHKYPVGSLVEILKAEDDLMETLGFKSTKARNVGMRLFVTNHYHTDSGHPMYDLSIDVESYTKKVKALEVLNSNTLVYGSKEYIDYVRDYSYASGSEVTHVEEEDLKLIK